MIARRRHPILTPLGEDGAFAIKLLLLVLALLVCTAGCGGQADSRGCDAMVRPPTRWVDCEVREATLAGCPASTTGGFRTQGRAANFERVAALVCCRGPSCEVAKVWSAEPARQTASYESARSRRKDGVL